MTSHTKGWPGLTAQSGDKLLSFVHGWRLMLPHAHGLINYIDTKAKCHHLKNKSVEGLCGRCLSEFIDWRYSQSCWYFLPTVALLTFSLVQHPPLSLFQSKDSVWLGGRGGCWVLLETIFYKSLTLCIWPDSEPTKLLDHPKQKPRRGGPPRTDKHLPQSPFTGKFFRWRHSALVSLYLFSLCLWPKRI